MGAQRQGGTGDHSPMSGRSRTSVHSRSRMRLHCARHANNRLSAVARKAAAKSAGAPLRPANEGRSNLSGHGRRNPGTQQRAPMAQQRVPMASRVMASTRRNTRRRISADATLEGNAPWMARTPRHSLSSTAAQRLGGRRATRRPPAARAPSDRSSAVKPPPSFWMWTGRMCRHSSPSPPWPASTTRTL